jgi:hypothetical protein
MSRDLQKQRDCVQEAIGLVKKSIDEGWVQLECAPASGGNSAIVRYIMPSETRSNGDQYVALVKPNEPVEISVARRLLEGRLNLGYVSQTLSGKSLENGLHDMLKKMDSMTVDFFGHAPKGVEFDDAVASLFVAKVEVYQHDPLAPDDALVDQVKAGNSVAVRALDEKGYFRKVAEMVFPTTFKAASDLETANAIGLDTYGREGTVAWHAHPSVTLSDGIENPPQIENGTVLINNGASFLVSKSSFEALESFSGQSKPDAPKLEKPRTFDLNKWVDSLSM